MHEQMDFASPAASNIGSIAKTISKLLRFRSSINNRLTSKLSLDQDDQTNKKKHSKNVDNYTQVFTKSKDESTKNKEAVESLIANLFMRISAIKAAYAQIQVAQSPYDPQTVQSADQAIVNELKLLSELKYSYLKNQLSSPPPLLSAQIQENRNLMKTYQITIKKLESDIQHRDSEIIYLRSKLMEYDGKNRALELKLHPDHSLASLDGLHLSGLDPTHFLAMVKHTMRSIKSFVKLMINEMESAGWDLDAAAKAIQPDALKKPEHRIFAFESFVSQKMFADFHNQNFGLESLEERFTWDSHKFFTEFVETKPVKIEQLLSYQKRKSSAFGKFCRVKYLATVHPTMEASFFGEAVNCSTKSDFFFAFAEMARRVWLLHCLFFSFGREMGNSIFQVKKGSRFSEAYMESVVEEASCSTPTVVFMVVPGFRVGKLLFSLKFIYHKMELGCQQRNESLGAIDTGFCFVDCCTKVLF